MREFNALKDYPQPAQPRIVGPNIRTIRSRIIASYRGKEYYDGDRKNGYGGFHYDGRWKKVAQSMCKEYNLGLHSSVLQIGCEKGFLLHDLHAIHPAMTLAGVEVSKYAIDQAMPDVKPLILHGSFTNLPYADGCFDLVIAIGVVYCLNLHDVLLCLREIQRVGKGKAFITLGAYRNEQGKRLFEYWTVLGSTILHVDAWTEVLAEAGYTGDYWFTTSDYLRLEEAKA
jgi:hypothetical protein